MRERAKQLIAELLSLTNNIPIFAATDCVEEVQRLCNEYPKNISQYLSDYLYLNSEYSWIFKEE